MMSFLQTGKALYILAAVCLAGIISRLIAGSFYKGLIKESVNMALTKNKYLLNSITNSIYSIIFLMKMKTGYNCNHFNITILFENF